MDSKQFDALLKDFMAMFPITSAELNYLVFRYLQESGFTHSAFVLGYEAGIHKSTIDGDLTPPGALVKFIGKGLQYLEMEANLSNSDTDLDEDFSFIKPIDLITKSPEELHQMIKEKKRILQKDGDKDNIKDKEIEGERGRVGEKGREKHREKTEKDKQHEKRGVIDMVSDKKERPKSNREGPEPMDISIPSTSKACEIPKSDITILEGHASEVCTCAWSPTGSLLASGSGDSTARIWNISDGSSGSNTRTRLHNFVVLKHVKSKTDEKSEHVTTLDWNVDGTLLASGSYDGQARIWSTNGELRSTLTKHKGPIFSVKWNKKGNYLVTGSCDKTAIVWDVKSVECKQQFEVHTGPVLDMDWRNNVLFATSSTDAMIHVFKIGERHPIKTFSGHKGEVNCVKWNPSGMLLASCSDDRTVKLWSMKHDKYVHALGEHTKEIYTMRWSPTGLGTSNPNKQLVLASASFDSTVKIWDVEVGKLLHTLAGHRGPVYSVAFSPNGEYLASGSLDGSLHIWSLKDHKIVKTYTSSGGIFEVSWNKNGDKIAGCFANKTVCVLDFRM